MKQQDNSENNSGSFNNLFEYFNEIPLKTEPDEINMNVEMFDDNDMTRALLKRKKY